MTVHSNVKKAIGQHNKLVSEAYRAEPADPLSTKFQKQYTVEQSMAVSRNTDRCSIGQLRIAHNSLYDAANNLLDEAGMHAAYLARERLWNAIIDRDRR